MLALGFAGLGMAAFGKGRARRVYRLICACFEHSETVEDRIQAALFRCAMSLNATRASSIAAGDRPQGAR